LKEANGQSLFALITTRLITLIEQEVDQPSEAICLAALAPAIAIESGADTRNRKKVSGTSFF